MSRSRKQGRLRAAIIGCGKIAGGYDAVRSSSRGKIRTHAKAYASDPRFDLTAACDSNSRNLLAFCRRWRVARSYRDARAMLQIERPDVVSVCAPTRAHRRILAEIARHPAKIVFAEKPLTGSLREARAVLKKFGARRIPVAVDYLRRWCPNHRALRKIISSGRLGRLRAFDAAYSGDLLNIGSHLIDLILWLAGPIERVRGRELTLKDGVTGFLERKPGEVFRLELLFDRGFIRIDRFGYEGECRIWRGRKLRTLFRFLRPEKGIDSALGRAIRNIGDHVTRGRRLECRGGDALKVLAVCEAIRSGRSVRLARSG